jgi:hypothetical protein
MPGAEASLRLKSAVAEATLFLYRDVHRGELWAHYRTERPFRIACRPGRNQCSPPMQFLLPVSRCSFEPEAIHLIFLSRATPVWKAIKKDGTELGI